MGHPIIRRASVHLFSFQRAFESFVAIRVYVFRVLRMRALVRAWLLIESDGDQSARQLFPHRTALLMRARSPPPPPPFQWDGWIGGRRGIRTLLTFCSATALLAFESLSMRVPSPCPLPCLAASSLLLPATGPSLFHGGGEYHEGKGDEASMTNERPCRR